MAKKKPSQNISEIEKLNMEFLDLKLKNTSGSLKETHKLSEMRKNIARLKTKIRMEVEK
jgi:ribosomal protein L29